MLGIAPGPDISLTAAASLAGIPVVQVRAVLRELENASLVQEYVPGRYRMHDLIRLYATDTAGHLAHDVQQAALRRVLDFYTHTAHAAERLLNPHRESIQLDPPAPGAHPHPLPDDPAALAWLDTEHRCLLAAQHIAATHRWHHTVWQLAWALSTFHYRRGHRHDKLAVWRAAFVTAAYLPNPTARALAHRDLGFAYADLGRHEKAIEHLHQAIALAEDHHDPTNQAHAHYTLARAWQLRGDDRSARDHATQALHLYRTLDQPMWEAAALNAVGWYAARLGDYDTARTHCQAALALYQHHHDPDGEAGTLDSLGYIDHHTGHHHHAIDHYQQALTLRRDFGDTYHTADALDRLGHPHTALSQHNQARAVWREALQLYQDQRRDTDADRVQRHLDDLDRPP